MDKELLQIPAVIKYIKTMADKSIRLSVDTQELSPEDKAKIFGMHDILGWFMFTIIELEGDIAIPEYVGVEPEDKSPSKRLRDVLFVYYTQRIKSANNKITFDDFYRNEMDKISNHYKSKLSRPEF